MATLVTAVIPWWAMTNGWPVLLTPLRGVHLVDDMTYSITIKAEELPYHYDITYASLRPRPLAVIAPDCDVVDTENGAQITGDFTADLLEGDHQQHRDRLPPPIPRSPAALSVRQLR